MITKNIKKEHILKAIEEIESTGIPKLRHSKKFVLEHNHKYYPPKYIISLANRFANGVELDSEEFSGGKETNEFLEKLGFRIIDKSFSTQRVEAVVRYKKTNQTKSIHSENCKDCKDRIKELLRKIYGAVELNYKFEVGTYPEAFRNSEYYWKLKEIYEALKDYRRFEDFIKAETLPHCDYYIPDPGFIVEFDESQHFTKPREIALSKYPEELRLGFDRNMWMNLSKKLNRKDNDPPYRDEQRAWYDTLRDFLPEYRGLKPTVRLFSRDFKLCSLNHNDSSDVMRFKSFLSSNNNVERIEVKEDAYPSLGRIVIAGDWRGNIESAKNLLKEVHKKWPKEKKVKLLITCGGFIQFEWPKFLTSREIGDNKYPNKKAIDVLVSEAKKCARYVLGGGVGEKLRDLTDYLTFGVDSKKEKISTTKNVISQPHVELVILVDLKKNKLYWTGKSYPTSSQERGLIRISDLTSHFFDLEDVGKIMILGCHDLSIFNNRNWESTGLWRKGIKLEFRELAKKEKPIFVLHHPHTTVKKRTWLVAWNTLQAILPSVEQYIGSGIYFEPDRLNSEYDPIEDVLDETKYGNTIDIIRGNEYR